MGLWDKFRPAAKDTPTTFRSTIPVDRAEIRIDPQYSGLDAVRIVDRETGASQAFGPFDRQVFDVTYRVSLFLNNIAYDSLTPTWEAPEFCAPGMVFAYLNELGSVGILNYDFMGITEHLYRAGVAARASVHCATLTVNWDGPLFVLTAASAPELTAACAVSSDSWRSIPGLPEGFVFATPHIGTVIGCAADDEDARRKLVDRIRSEQSREDIVHLLSNDLFRWDNGDIVVEPCPHLDPGLCAHGDPPQLYAQLWPRGPIFEQGAGKRAIEALPEDYRPLLWPAAGALQWAVSTDKPAICPVTPFHLRRWGLSVDEAREAAMATVRQDAARLEITTEGDLFFARLPEDPRRAAACILVADEWLGRVPMGPELTFSAPTRDAVVGTIADGEARARSLRGYSHRLLTGFPRPNAERSLAPGMFVMRMGHPETYLPEFTLTPWFKHSTYGEGSFPPLPAFAVHPTIPPERREREDGTTFEMVADETGRARLQRRDPSTGQVSLLPVFEWTVLTRAQADRLRVAAADLGGAAARLITQHVAYNLEKALVSPDRTTWMTDQVLIDLDVPFWKLADVANRRLHDWIPTLRATPGEGGLHLTDPHGGPVAAAMLASDLLPPPPGGGDRAMAVPRADLLILQSVQDEEAIRALRRIAYDRCVAAGAEGLAAHLYWRHIYGISGLKLTRLEYDSGMTSADLATDDARVAEDASAQPKAQAPEHPATPGPPPGTPPPPPPPVAGGAPAGPLTGAPPAPPTAQPPTAPPPMAPPPAPPTGQPPTAPPPASPAAPPATVPPPPPPPPQRPGTPSDGTPSPPVAPAPWGGHPPPAPDGREAGPLLNLVLHPSDDIPRDSISRPFLSDVELVLEHPESARELLTQTEAARFGIDPGQAFEAASRRLMGYLASADTIQVGARASLTLPAAPDCAASTVFFWQSWLTLALDGGPVFFAPNRREVRVCGANDALTLTELRLWASRAYTQATRNPMGWGYPVSPVPFTVEGAVGMVFVR